MRITGGSFRGRKVICPPRVIRPAMDRMRESMFSILGNMEGLSFLDCFAGSGVVALEALSRGAATALLIEKDGGKRKTIMDNLTIAFDDPGFADAFPQMPPRERVTVVIRPVERILKAGMDRYDIVHFDPPFPMKGKAKLLEMAEKADQPAAGGTLMIHYPSEDTIPTEIGSLRQYDKRTYGRSHLAFFTRDS